MTKKKQSKRSGKQAAKKTVKRPGIDATLHEITAVEPPSPPLSAHDLSAPEPLVPVAEPTDIAAVQPLVPVAEPTDIAAVQPPAPGSSIQDVPVDSQASPENSTDFSNYKFTESSYKHGLEQAPIITASNTGISSPQSKSTKASTPVPPAPDTAAEPVLTAGPDAPVTAEISTTPDLASETPSASNNSQNPASAPTLGKDDAAPTPPTPSTSARILDATKFDIPLTNSSEHQVTTYDIAAMDTPTSPKVPDLGSLTRSSRALPVKEETAYKWRAPVDYFGASAAAFSSSLSGTSGERDLSTIKKPSAELPASSSPNGLSVFSSRSSASPSVEQPPSTTLGPELNYNPAIQLEPQTPGLSPKMAKFVSSLRERELAASGSSPTLQQQTEATAVDIAPVNSPALPPVTSPLTSPTEPAQSPAMQTPAPVKTEPKQPTSGSNKSLNQTARDLSPSQVSKSSQPAEPKEASGLEVTPKPYDQDEEALSPPKIAAFVADLRESIISQGKPEDWHPVTQKKPRATNDAFSPGLEELQMSPSDAPPKTQQPEPERHYSLEELAAMDPELALPTPTVHQQSIRRLKSKTTAGVRFEIYLLIYFICLGLSWVTEQSAAAGTCRDAGQRIESAVQLIAPKPLADNFIQGVNTYDNREIKLHPFNPNKRPNLLQVVIHRIFAFCSGLSAAFGRIPGTIFVSSAANSLGSIMVLLTYVSIGILSLLIYFKFRRSMTYGVTDLLIVPICLIAAASGISAIFAAVLSTSASLAAIYLPNTIVLFTTVTVVLSVLDMARRSFVGRKQAIMRD